MKICIGLLTNRGMKGKMVTSLLEMIASTPEHEYKVILVENPYTIAEARNYLAVQAVKNECDYLFMVDDDMVFPPETLQVLLSREKDIIGLPFNVKVPRKEGDIRKLHNVTYAQEADGTIISKEDEPFEVIAIGTGLILIKTDVFKKLSQPFFDFSTYENGMVKVGEDSWFCYKATENGLKIWVEPTLQGLGHIGDFTY